MSKEVATQRRPNANPEPMTVARARELLTQFGIEMPDATEYYPTFNDHVFTVNPNGTFTPVNPDYCLSPKSTMQLMVILADLEPVGYLDTPSPVASGSTFGYTQNVPWLVFNNGAERNAGTLAFNWRSNNGNPGGKNAEANCRQDIAWG